MANSVRNICAKNYQNLTIGFQVTVENVGDVFLGHSVVRPQKVSCCSLSLSSLNIDNFSRFFSPEDLARNLLLSGMHITLIMSLHYLVKY